MTRDDLRALIQAASDAEAEYNRSTKREEEGARAEYLKAEGAMWDVLTELIDDRNRLDWMDGHVMESPTPGVFTDGRLGFNRGHVVESRWTVGATPYRLRDAIDVCIARAAALSDAGGAP